MHVQVVERMEYHGIDTQPVLPLWQGVIEARRRRAALPAPIPPQEIWKARRKIAELAEHDQTRALGAALEANRLVEHNVENQRRRADLNAQVAAARIAAVLATRKLLMGIIEHLGTEMNRIAVAHETACLNYPPVLPEEIFRLGQRARLVSQLLAQTELSVPVDTKGYLPYRSAIAYVRPDLRQGVLNRCGAHPEAVAL